MKKYLLALLCFSGLHLGAQEYFPKNDGVKAKNENHIALTNAMIQVSPDQVIKKGTLLIKNDRIIEVGKKVSLPKNAVVIDMKGKHIYPSFIETVSGFGVKLPKKNPGGRRSAQYDSEREGFYWNDHVMPENQAHSSFSFDEKKAKSLLEQGFGAVNSHVNHGIVRGSGVLVSLNPEAKNSERILKSQSAQYLSFKKSQFKRQSYPTSLMGSMALIRQVHADADWYDSGQVSSTDQSLEAWNKNKPLVQFFLTQDKNNALRASRLGKENGLNYVIKGGGDEYERAAEIKASGNTYVIPVNFPKAYDVSDPNKARYVSLNDMKKWKMAPENPAILASNGVNFALTTDGLEKVGDFNKNLRKAIKSGLDKKTALAALTTVPASILKVENDLGTLKKGAYANFLVCSGDIFDQNTLLYENWVQGAPVKINSYDTKNFLGSYQLTVDGKSYDLTVSKSVKKPKASVKQGDKKLKSGLQVDGKWFNLVIEDDKGYIRLSGPLSDKGQLSGTAQLSNGSHASWKAVRSTDESAEKSKKETEAKSGSVAISFPNNGFGFKELPSAQTLLFKNATVWTNEEEGILTETDVLVKDGKIAAVGKNLKAGSAQVIDATGKHLTTGIIDEHSHIATLSTNESGQNSTAEVTMEDAINHEDVNIYRNLSGGVTMAQILHGSANPIGGRSAIVKLKWGHTPEEMIDQKAPKFIKFALGENVKQSNWNSYSRFPQTRMGVEQVYEDYFQRAKEYDALKKSGKPYRKDYEMEVLAEILNKERFISCHSYVQSEINMLMKVAERFDFNVNTFTHILEGYKVADKMKEHGVGGSTFSDWWAYKYEVNDAIPYNAAIMHSQGVVTAINSDDAEMSRRLNQEAAKTIKYGGVSEEDAWKFVTLNPAKLLHVDDRLGSIKVGKEADLVLWSDHPLSVKAKAEKTIIEGVVYFDIERDAAMRMSLQKEKNDLINLMLQEKVKGGATQKPVKKTNRLNHCDTEEL